MPYVLRVVKKQWQAVPNKVNFALLGQGNASLVPIVLAMSGDHRQLFTDQ
jgi:hypothetical protein